MAPDPREIKLGGRGRRLLFDHDGDCYRVAFYGTEWKPGEGFRPVRRTARDPRLDWAIAAAMGGFVPDGLARSISEYAEAMGWTVAADPLEVPPNAPAGVERR